MSKRRLNRRRQRLTGGVKVTLILLGLFAGSALSASQARAEMPTPRRAPGLVGKALEGETLQATSGQWLYADGLDCDSRPLELCRITWQWQRCNPQATSCADIPGQTTDRYLLTRADVGNRVRIVQTLSKTDCDAHGKNCRDVPSPQVSSPTDLVAAKIIPPSVSQLPEITGMPMEEETLSASTGRWNGDQPISMTWQWYRCDASGNNPAPIAGATAQTYNLTRADVGSTIRVTGTATNAGGTSFATSRQTPVIAAFGPTPQRPSIGIDRVTLPHRLVIDRVAFAPRILRSRSPFTARFRVSDTRGFRIEGALVQVVSVPFGLVRTAGVVETEADGWATLTLRPTQRLDPSRTRWLTFAVSARKPGERARGGVSANRLVRIKLVAPAR